ncbi:hypothetical protein BH10CHL1_BH10CHL1_45410 [soil metagenome]
MWLCVSTLGILSPLIDDFVRQLADFIGCYADNGRVQ